MKTIKNSIFFRCIAILICGMLLLTSCGKSETNENKSSTLINEVLSQLTNVFKYYDDISEQYKTVLDSISSADKIESAQLIKKIDNVITVLQDTLLPVNSLKSKEEQFDDEGLYYLEFEIAFKQLGVTCNEYKNTLSVIKWYLLEYTLDDRDEILKKIVELNLSILENEIKLQYVSLNQFLINIDEDIAADFRNTELVKFASYKREALDWQSLKSILEDWSETALNNIEDALVQYEKIVGEQQEILDLMNAIIKTYEQITETKKEAREKFKPELDNEFAELWYKALRFYSAKDEEYIDLCFDIFIQKAKSAVDDRFTEESAAKITETAKAFWTEVHEGKREGGILVLCFDVPNSHAFLQTADIIIKINDINCNVVEDYIDNKKNGETNKLTYLRLENGKLIEYEDIVPADSSAVMAGVDLIEYFD